MHENEMRRLAILFNDLSIILGVIIELIFQRVELTRANSMELVGGKRHVGNQRNQTYDKRTQWGYASWEFPQTYRTAGAPWRTSHRAPGFARDAATMHHAS